MGKNRESVISKTTKVIMNFRLDILTGSYDAFATGRIVGLCSIAALCVSNMSIAWRLWVSVLCPDTLCRLSYRSL